MRYTAHQILKMTPGQINAVFEERDRYKVALENIVNVIGPTSAAQCEGCLYEMETALALARKAIDLSTEGGQANGGV